MIVSPSVMRDPSRLSFLNEPLLLLIGSSVWLPFSCLLIGPGRFSFYEVYRDPPINSPLSTFKLLSVDDLIAKAYGNASRFHRNVSS